MRKQPDSKHYVLNILLSLMLLVQGAMPAGYMPASVDSGWLVMLCPDGLPEGFLADPAETPAASPHHHHHTAAAHLAAPDQIHQDRAHHHAPDTASVDYCPLGSALNAPELVAGAALPLEEARVQDRWQPPANAHIAALRDYVPTSRDPPVS